MELMRTFLRALARIALAGIFVSGGADAFRNPQPRAPRAANLGLPNPQLAVKANGAAMVAAGAALALGVKPKAAAAVLAGLLVPTTLAGHAFWNEGDERARRMQQTQFFKNLGLFGGALLVLAERPKR